MILYILWYLFLSWLSSTDGKVNVVSKQTDKNRRTQPISVMSRPSWDPLSLYIKVESNVSRIPTTDSMTEDLFGPKTKDLRPRKVSKMKTLKKI